MKDGKFSIVTALADAPLNDDCSYAGGGYSLIVELLKSFDINQLQEVHSNFDELKLELEKLILIQA